MRNVRFWVPTGIGILLTPLFMYAVMHSKGGGHDGPGLMLAVYPVPTLILALFDSVAPHDALHAQAVNTLTLILLFGGAIVQFPLYGFILSYANIRESCWVAACAGIVWVHLFAVAVWLVIYVIVDVLLKV